ncbi:MAG: hypothetical protein FJ297_15350 [Planctomycetes bacterium]|nr:hypothetical protein [Planctomycetota bacterium]
MPADVARITDLRSLRSYIEMTICERNELEVGAFRMTERILLRGGTACGIYFCMHGPRSVKLTAIWETDRNTILFYGSNGQRQHRTQLTADTSLTATTA